MKNSLYQKKYLKYKSKYLSLKNQIGGELLPPRDISKGSKERYCYMLDSNEANCLNAGQYEFVNFGKEIGVTESQPLQTYLVPLIFNNLTKDHSEVKWFMSSDNNKTWNYYLIFGVPQPFQSWFRSITEMF
jgi:hypothetical protein